MDRPRRAQLCEANYLSVQRHFAVEITLPPNGYWVCTARVRVRALGRERAPHAHATQGACRFVAQRLCEVKRGCHFVFAKAKLAKCARNCIWPLFAAKALPFRQCKVCSAKEQVVAPHRLGALWRKGTGRVCLLGQTATGFCGPCRPAPERGSVLGECNG